MFSPLTCLRVWYVFVLSPARDAARESRAIDDGSSFVANARTHQMECMPSGVLCALEPGVRRCRRRTPGRTFGTAGRYLSPRRHFNNGISSATYFADLVDEVCGALVFRRSRGKCGNHPFGLLLLFFFFAVWNTRARWRTAAGPCLTRPSFLCAAII